MHSHSDFIGIYGSRLRLVESESWLNSDLVHQIASVGCEFDCFVINFADDFDCSNNFVLEALASRAGSWIEVFGYCAEKIHDAIDLASVKIGRQRSIGDGSPMTAWYDSQNHGEIASYIWAGGQGECDLKSVLIFGSESVRSSFRMALTKYKR